MPAKRSLVRCDPPTQKIVTIILVLLSMNSMLCRVRTQDSGLSHQQGSQVLCDLAEGLQVSFEHSGFKLGSNKSEIGVAGPRTKSASTRPSAVRLAFSLAPSNLTWYRNECSSNESLSFISCEAATRLFVGDRANLTGREPAGPVNRARVARASDDGSHLAVRRRRLRALDPLLLLLFPPLPYRPRPAGAGWPAPAAARRPGASVSSSSAPEFDPFSNSCAEFEEGLDAEGRQAARRPRLPKPRTEPTRARASKRAHPHARASKIRQTRF